MSDRGSDHDVTALLHAWSDGDRGAFEEVFPLVYEELRRRAGNLFAREDRGHTLQPTIVVHELFLDLVKRRRVCWEDRNHFFGYAAKQMRRILVSHARRRDAAKRGGGVQLQSLCGLREPGVMPPERFLRLHEALDDLARFNPVGARIVEVHFFGGLTHEDIAEAMGFSPATVRNKYNAARAWLRRQLDRS